MGPAGFFLGTHEAHWLATLDVPLFISRRRLPRTPRRRARGRWALDSGGFTELSMFGEWTIRPAQYVDEVRRWADALGAPDWCAPMDMMCEPHVLAKTGLTVAEHQARTIDSVHELRRRAPEVPFVPVLQGWQLDDYLKHAEAYERAGVDLRSEPVVGVGSVCRRQGTAEATDIFRTLHSLGLRLHGFGLKSKGLLAASEHLHSSDSLAWSYNARKNPPMEGCRHARCNNCPRWALRWRERVIAQM